MKFECPNCSQRLEVRAAYAGRDVECPTCEKQITIPQPKTAPPPPQAPPPPPVAPPAPPSRPTTTSGEKAQELLPGESKKKRYTVLGTIDKGGMGEVSLAEDANLGRPVAMKKLLLPSEATDEEVARFIGEAQVTGQLEHPSIVPVHELGIDSDGEIFYTMKRISGVTLSDVLDGFLESDQAILKRWPLPRLLSVFQRVCDAVSFAHSRGVVHRDLKPDNIMLGEFGEVILLDWGIAKVLNQDSEAEQEPSDEKDEETKEDESVFRIVPVRTGEGINLMTLAGALMGTPLYMSPEQVKACESVDARADVFSLGAILYEILALAPPYRDVTIHKVLERARTADRETLETVEKGAIRKKFSWPHLPGGRMPVAVSAVAMKAIEKEPEARYQSVAEMQADIDAYLNGFATEAENAGLGRLLVLFIKRHKLAALFSAALFCVLLTGLIINMRERRIAEANEKRAIKAEGIALDRLNDVEEARNIANNRLVRQLVNRGISHLSKNDTAGSLPWFVSALESEADPVGIEAQAHRVRLGTILRASPKPTLLGFHSGAVNAIAFDQTGDYVVTAGEDGMVRSWSVKEKKSLAEFQQPEALVNLTVNQKQDRLISICANGTAQLWQFNPLQPIGDPIKPGMSRSAITHTTFSPDSSIIAISSGTRFKTPGSRDIMIPGPPRTMQVPAGSTRLPGGVTIPRFTTITIPGPMQRISSYSTPRGRTNLWSMETKDYLESRFSIRGWTNQAAFAPDGKWLATAGGAQIGSAQVKIWNIETGEPRFESISQKQDIHHVEFSPDGSLIITGSGDATVRVRGEVQLWDAQTGEQIGSPMQHSDLITHATFSQEGDRILTASWDGTARVWDKIGSPVLAPLSHDDKVTAASFLPGSGDRILTASRDRSVRVWNAQTGLQALPPLLHASPVLCANWDPSGSQIATGTDAGAVRIWNMSKDVNQPVLKHDQTGQKLFSGYGPKGDFVFAMGGGRIELVISGSNKSAKKAGISLSKFSAWKNEKLIWEGELGGQSAMLDTPVVQSRLPIYSPDGKYISVSTPGATSPDKLLMWEIATGEKVTLPDLGSTRCLWLGKNADQILALVIEERNLQLRGLPDGKLIGNKITLPEESSLALVTINPDIEKLAMLVAVKATNKEGKAVQSFKLLVCNYINDTVETPKILDSDCPKLEWMEISSTGSVLGIPSGAWYKETLKQPGELLWWVDGKAPSVKSGHRGGINYVAPSSDRQLFVTCGNDRAARVWNQNGDLTLPPLIHSDPVKFAALSTDGRFIGTGAGHLAQVWDASTGEPVTPPLQHSGLVSSIEFHPDGEAITTSSLAGEVFVWDLTPDLRPLVEIKKDAKLRSGHWLDALGGYSPLSIESLEKLK